MGATGVTLVAMPILPASHPHLSQGSMFRVGCVLFEETAALIADNGHGKNLQYFGYFALLESSDMCDMYYFFKGKSLLFVFGFATCMSASTCFSNIICVWYI